MRTSSLATVVLVSLVAGQGAAAELAVPFEKYVLPSNGLEVILSRDTTLPVVAINVWYHAGPINEPPKRTGFAHLFEHLMFQGSAHIADDEHFRRLDAAGASQINGTTSFDRTNYFETVPKNQLELALWLESDRMGFLKETLTQEKLDNQREVVMNERRQTVENRPYGISDERLVQLLYPTEHPYFGDVIGSMEHLGAATLDDVKQFYERYYAPSNATLAIVGDFETAEVKRLVEKYFGSLKKRPSPAAVKVTTPPIDAERRDQLKEPVPAPRITMGWLTAAAYQPGDADCDVLSFILGTGESSRLHRKIVYELQLAQSVSAWQQSHQLTSTFTVTALARPGVDPKQLEAEIDKVIRELGDKPPTDEELLRARNQLKTAMIAGLEDVGARADLLNRYNQYVGDPGYLAKDLARYDVVTKESVHAMAKKVLSAPRAVVTTVPR